VNIFSLAYAILGDHEVEHLISVFGKPLPENLITPCRFSAAFNQIPFTASTPSFSPYCLSTSNSGENVNDVSNRDFLWKTDGHAVMTRTSKATRPYNSGMSV